MAPSTKDQRPSVKDDDTYMALRESGASKEKAARIANAKANDRMNPSKKGGRADPYEEWSHDDLYAPAQKIGVDGRSKMAKSELIDALRNH
nr:hypothetical protein [Marinicella sp. W31]MDC2878195.1 hypothetical protein [Marinicella sp. W31]